MNHDGIMTFSSIGELKRWTHHLLQETANEVHSQIICKEKSGSLDSIELRNDLMRLQKLSAAAALAISLKKYRNPMFRDHVCKILDALKVALCLVNSRGGYAHGEILMMICEYSHYLIHGRIMPAHTKSRKVGNISYYFIN
ncbi:hypothetical protein [uncultured Methylobacterium sp.]|jgi:hypothetical protein|uniref:hypothetical protein n=1 Tax=uncultured Methylobacterium sp. TaxID=157278 RepID=UPI002606B12E|nr:hypothetical protein [uncultured Methylobacterium sp.]